MPSANAPASERINCVFDTLLEIFGHSLRAELIRIDAPDKVVHLRGADLLRDTMDRSMLSANEIANITKGNKLDRMEGGIPWQLYEIVPGYFLDAALSVDAFVMVSLGQLVPPLKTIKLSHGGSTYVVIMDSTFLGYELTEEYFHEFWPRVKRYLAKKASNLRDEFMKRFVPSAFKDDFAYVTRLLSSFAMLRIENKPVECGFVFVQDYDSFRSRFSVDLFLEFDKSYDLRDLGQHPQPLLEVADGRDGFLVVDSKLAARAIFFPLVTPEGVDPLARDRKSLGQGVVLARVCGTRLTRIAVNGRIALEIHDGQLRVRDYKALEDILESARDTVKGLPTGRELTDGILDLSLNGKGTIIVFGIDSVTDEFKGGVRGKISLCYDDRLRKERLAQLTSTDGVLLVDCRGKVIAINAIWATNESKESASSHSGGARSLAARALAEKHPECLVVKVSEDGPISVYLGGVLRLVV